LNNKRLAQIIKDPGIATEKEVKLIHSFSEEYSYSPFLKVLLARLDNLHGTKNKAKSLAKAAIYIADRSILKDFLSNDKLSTSPSKEVLSKPKVRKDKKLDKAVAVIAEEEVVPKDEKAVEKEKEVAVKEKKKEDVVEKQVEEIIKEQDIELVAKAEISSEETPEVIESDQDESKEIKEETEEIVEAPPVVETESGLDKLTEQEEISDVPEEISDVPEEMADVPEEISEKREGELADKQEDTQEGKQEGLKEAPEHSEAVDTVDTVDAVDTVDTVDEEETSSLSKEIMKNISELKKHKASLLNLLNIDPRAKDKSSKKEKSKKKDGHKNKKKDSVGEEIKSEERDLKASPSTEDHEEKNYPDYEEEDPVVIKDFLTRLEESNPPPKKKLKKEEQEKLIEKFIQSDPQMQNVRSPKELKEKKDLSAPSVKFRDDIISENLANIMIKQGKHETAIDIYKKLIWKFPQKKTYFATQIEELKKKLKN